MNIKKYINYLVGITIIATASYLSQQIDPVDQAYSDNSTTVIDDYEQARSIFWNELYAYGGETLYCGEKFNGDYQKDINIEHVFPMSWVARALKCGKRWECREKSQRFNLIEADLHNLYPAKVNINKTRSSHPFGLVKGETRKFGSCDFEVDEKRRLAEPRPEVRGEIARTMFYMADRYDLILYKKQRDLLKKWNETDLVSPEEKKRNHLIKNIQGNLNPYIN